MQPVRYRRTGRSRCSGHPWALFLGVHGPQSGVGITDIEFDDAFEGFCSRRWLGLLALCRGNTQRQAENSQHQSEEFDFCHLRSSICCGPLLVPGLQGGMCEGQSSHSSAPASGPLHPLHLEIRMFERIDQEIVIVPYLPVVNMALLERAAATARRQANTEGASLLP